MTCDTETIFKKLKTKLQKKFKALSILTDRRYTVENICKNICHHLL